MQVVLMNILSFVQVVTFNNTVLFFVEILSLLRLSDFIVNDKNCWRDSHI